MKFYALFCTAALFAVAALFSVLFASSAFADTECINVEFADGKDYSHQTLGHPGDLLDPHPPHGGSDDGGQVRNMNLTGTTMIDIRAINWHFTKCLFRKSKVDGFFYNCRFDKDCDLTDMFFAGGPVDALDHIEHLQATKNAKDKSLRNVRLVLHHNAPADFSGWDFREGSVRVSEEGQAHPNWIFTDARIADDFGHPSIHNTLCYNHNVLWLHKEQFVSTYNYKQKTFSNASFMDGRAFDATDLDLSGAKFSHCYFGNFKGIETVNFTDAEMKNCDFSKADKLTLAQIQSTKNYKTGWMKSIVLPLHILKEIKVFYKPGDTEEIKKLREQQRAAEITLQTILAQPAVKYVYTPGKIAQPHRVAELELQNIKNHLASLTVPRPAEGWKSNYLNGLIGVYQDEIKFVMQATKTLSEQQEKIVSEIVAPLEKQIAEIKRLQKDKPEQDIWISENARRMHRLETLRTLYRQVVEKNVSDQYAVPEGIVPPPPSAKEIEEGEYALLDVIDRKDAKLFAAEIKVREEAIQFIKKTADDEAKSQRYWKKRP